MLYMPMSIDFRYFDASLPTKPNGWLQINPNPQPPRTFSTSIADWRGFCSFAVQPYWRPKEVPSRFQTQPFDYTINNHKKIPCETRSINLIGQYANPNANKLKNVQIDSTGSPAQPYQSPVKTTLKTGQNWVYYLIKRLFPENKHQK